MGWKICLLFLFPIVSFFVQLGLVEVEPGDYACTHKKRVRGDPESLFHFLMSPRTLERLLPWLTRFREADKRIISAGKSYSAFMEIPILGKRKVRAVLTEFKPSKLMALEFSDDFVGQRVVVEARSYHDRALLQTTIYSRRRSFLYQHTLGWAFRRYVEGQLERSTRIVAEMFESLDPPDAIPDFSRSNVFNR